MQFQPIKVQDLSRQAPIGWGCKCKLFLERSVIGLWFLFQEVASRAWRLPDWKPYFTRFVNFSLAFAHDSDFFVPYVFRVSRVRGTLCPCAFCGRWHVSHMCLVSGVPHITCALCCKCAVCVTCVMCHVCDCVSCVKDTQGQLSSGLFLLVVALVRALAVFGFVPDKVPALDKQWEEEKRQSRDRVGESLRSWKMSSICKHCRSRKRMSTRQKNYPRSLGWKNIQKAKKALVLK